jgi:hypothetical protein
MNYYKELQTDFWKVKRLEILERDDHKCQKCFNNSYERDYVGVTATLYHESDIYNIYMVEDKSPKKIFVKKALTSSRKIYAYIPNNEEDFIVHYAAIREVTNYDLRSIKYYHQIEELSSIKKVYIETKGTALESAIKILFGEEKLKRMIDQEFQPQTEKPVKSKWDENPKWYHIRNLHVHHKYYQIGLSAWEYPNDALLTLCWKCHEDLHKETKIKVFNENGEHLEDRVVCKRCFGAGYFPQFTHVECGRCFRCNGRRFE